MGAVMTFIDTILPFARWGGQGRNQSSDIQGYAKKYYPDSADDEWRNFYDAQPLPEIHLDDSNTRTRLYIYGFFGLCHNFLWQS